MAEADWGAEELLMLNTSESLEGIFLIRGRRDDLGPFIEVFRRLPNLHELTLRGFNFLKRNELSLRDLVELKSLEIDCSRKNIPELPDTVRSFSLACSTSPVGNYLQIPSCRSREIRALKIDFIDWGILLRSWNSFHFWKVSGSKISRHPKSTEKW